MKRHLLLGALAGLSLVGVLTAWAGFTSTFDALRDVGWLGLVWVCTLQLVSLALCAAALQLVTPGACFLSCLTARWIRDGASNLVAIVPGIGEIAGARALVLLNTCVPVAIASTVIDMVIEAVSQAVYTLFGLVPLLLTLEQGDRVRWLAAAAAASVPIAAVYLITRHQGALVTVERLMKRLAGLLGFSVPAGSLEVTAAVGELYRRHGHVVLALLVHLAAWTVGAVQVWAAAQAMDRPIGFGAALALESIAYAVRGALFVVPWGAGVQEGSFVLVGAVLGIDAAGSVALSLILRARDLVLGLPAVLLWSAVEGRRLVNGRRPADVAQ